jgi:predicted dehydrogenase
MLKEVENCNLIGIHDLDKEKLIATSEEFSVTPFEEYESLLGKVDAVSIVATTSAAFASS